jgi:C2H2-type zinc finger protein
VSRELVVQTWCDICAASGYRSPASGVSLAALGSPRLVDTCDEHKEQVDKAIDFLFVYSYLPDTDATPRKATFTDSGPQPCPVCEKVMTSKGSLSSHVRRIHGTTLSALAGKGERRRKHHAA